MLFMNEGIVAETISRLAKTTVSYSSASGDDFPMMILLSRHRYRAFLGSTSICVTFAKHLHHPSLSSVKLAIIDGWCKCLANVN
ncbi:hypothetical protein M9Y10_038472 [Tritrichomonas musculus]|uniref:Uncharacterized protein n=1 Tax=Tritrichomonas musculus TaxID=1915356 RepID=A0ABR2K985_9EUKA